MSLCWHAAVKLRGDDLEFLERVCSEAVPAWTISRGTLFFAHVKNN
jgi:hypothetical protein